jgi:hypothetical protein
MDNGGSATGSTSRARCSPQGELEECFEKPYMK